MSVKHFLNENLEVFCLNSNIASGDAEEKKPSASVTTISTGGNGGVGGAGGNTNSSVTPSITPSEQTEKKPMATFNTTSTGGTGGVGGAGGNAINITLVDNYVSLMMMYTLMLTLGKESSMEDSVNQKWDHMLSKLESMIDEEREHRKSILTTLNSINTSLNKDS